MNQIFSVLKRTHLKQILTTALVGLVLVVSTAIGQFGFALNAQAATATPEAREYQVDQGNRAKATADEAGSGFGNSLKNAAENVKEKLNLDEPLPDSTKAFFKQVRGEDVQVEEQRPTWGGGAEDVR